MKTDYLKQMRGTQIYKALESLAGLVLLALIFSILSPSFFSVNNLLTVTLQISIYCMLAMGCTYVLLVGGAELSAGSIVGLSGMVFCIVLGKGVPLVFAVIIALAVSVFCGWCNGFMVTKMHMIPFVATLGMQYVARGMTQVFDDGTSVPLRSAADAETVKLISTIGGGRLFGLIPYPTMIVIVFAIIHTIILMKTVYGRRTYAVGSNHEAARLSGINSNRTTVLAYMISGFMAGAAGLLLIARVATAQPTAGMSYEFEGIAAAVIGGVSMMGGEGNIPGAILGAVILGVMRNGLNLIGVNAFWQNVITGLVIIGAVYLDISRRRREASRIG